MNDDGKLYGAQSESSVVVIVLTATFITVLLLESFILLFAPPLVVYLLLFSLSVLILFLACRERYVLSYGLLIFLSTLGADYPLTSGSMTYGARPAIWIVDIPILFLLGYEFLAQRMGISDRKFYIPDLGKWYAVYILWELITVLLSDYYVVGLSQVVQSFRSLLFFLLIVNFVCDERRLKFAIRILFIAMLFHCAVGVLQWLYQGSFGSKYIAYFGGVIPDSGIDIYERYNIDRRLFGFSVGTYVCGLAGAVYVFAVFLYMIFSVSFSYVMYQSWTAGKWLVISVAMLSLYCLILVPSKGAYVGLTVGMFGFFVLYLIKRQTIFISKYSFMIIPMIVWAGTYFYERIFHTNLEASSFARIEVIKFGWEVFKNNPVFGMGLNSIPSYRIDYGVSLPYCSLEATIHNIYALTLAETGLIGIILFLVLYAKVFKAAIKNTMTINLFLYSTNNGILAGLIAFAVHGFFSWIYRRETVTFLVWLLIALIVAIRRIIEENKKM